MTLFNDSAQNLEKASCLFKNGFQVGPSKQQAFTGQPLVIRFCYKAVWIFGIGVAIAPSVILVFAINPWGIYVLALLYL